ncbi:MAG: YheT family hydrolase [Saprospiraceae bacterium]
MPFIANSTYQPPFFFRHYHLNTIYPALLRNVSGVNYERETIDTPDDDFIDLDWSKMGNGKQVVLVLHGLEGSADRHYIRGMIRQFNEQGWDGVGKNFRSCSGRPNRQKRSYHMGASDDLEVVINHLISIGYEEIIVVGFSLGANVTLKYLGEQGTRLPPQVKAGVAFSVPLHIVSANLYINRPRNKLYLKRFLDSLNEKVRIKATLYPELKELIPAQLPRDFTEFDDIFTGPIHGFKDAHDYWIQTSSKQFLPNINVPTLIVNALDDSFLSPQCYPHAEAEANNLLYLETPKHGGHVGFTTWGRTFWSEQRAWAFVKEKTQSRTTVK